MRSLAPRTASVVEVGGFSCRRRGSCAFGKQLARREQALMPAIYCVQPVAPGRTALLAPVVAWELVRTRTPPANSCRPQGYVPERAHVGKARRGADCRASIC